jgi:CDP-diacylglycerol--glycerol-3-phosphate 3-phosphatidyltransferase
MANFITLSRLALLPFIYCSLATGTDQGRWLGLALFTIAALTDLLDGFVARSTQTTSKLGAMLDILADRLLTLVTVGGLLVSGTAEPLAMAAGLVMVARDLVVASFAEALGAGRRVAESRLEKLKVAFQFIGLGLLIAPFQGFAGAQGAGLLALIGASLLAGLTVTVYAKHALATLKPKREPTYLSVESNLAEAYATWS